MNFSKNNKLFLLTLLLSLFLVNLSYSAEPRTWTNLKGQQIKAQLVSVDGDYVILRLENGRDSRVLRKTLSIGDQKFLEEYGGAEKIPIDPKAKITVPEKEMKFNSKTLIKRDDKFELPDGYSLQFDIVESEHFLVMSSGKVRGKDTAELAERLWYGMNFQHPGFAEKWGDEKKAIFLCGEKTDYDILGKYFVDQLANSGRAQEASNSARTWPMSAGAGLSLDNDTCEKYNLMRGARAFRADSKSIFQRGVWNPFPAHCLSKDVLDVQMGGAGGGVGSDGYYAISTGHGYYKEIQLADETVTSLLDANTYESDEVVKSGGFDDGRKWARTLRDLVKKEKVSPSIAGLYRVNRASELTPELTVQMYGFARYMQSTPDRISKFSKVMERVDTSRAIPVPLEMAKLFGFETVQEFENDWINYLKSTAFK